MTAAGRLGVPILFAALVLATLAAFAIVENERDHPQILGGDEVTPRFAPHGARDSALRSRMRARFTITRAEPRATVVVVDAERNVVRELATDVPLADDGEYSFVWDGTLAGGEPAPAGEYQMRVRLEELDRDLPLQGRSRLLSPSEAQAIIDRHSREGGGEG